MTDTRTGPEDREFSRELLRAISADEGGCFVDLPVVASNDVADLKQVLRGERIPNIPIDKKRAVTALARSESSAEASDILASIVADTEETTRVRAVAASNLGLMPPEAAERALLQNLTADDEVVRVEVFKSLGRIGTTEGLDRLKALPDPENDYAKRQLSLAKLAISFRSGSEERDVQDANSTLGIRWTTHAAKTVEGRQVQENIDMIWGSIYGITLNSDIGFEIGCGRTKHFLFLNDVMKRGAFVESIRSRNMIAGLLALQEEGTRHFTTRYLLLTSPSDAGLEVTIVRTNGDIVYAGEARPDGAAALRLTMRDVGLERTATEIEGLLSNDDIHLNLRVWRGTTRTKQHGEPIRV